MKSKNTTLLFILFLFSSLNSFAQSLNQDAEGFSTIVIPSANLNLDISNDIANFGYYGLFRRNNKRPKVTDPSSLFGIELKGKENGGLVNLFSEGNVSIGASANLIMGIRWFSETSKDPNAPKYSKKKEQLAQLKSRIQEKQIKFISLVDSLFKEHKINDTILSQAKSINETYNIDLVRIKIKSLRDLKTEIRNNEQNNRNISPEAIEVIIRQFDFIHFQRLELRKKLIEEIEDYEEAIWKPTFHKFFVRGGASGTSFTLDNGDNFTSIEDRFKKNEFYGFNLEIAYNLQVKNNNFFGVSVETSYSNNLANLSSTEFTLVQLDTSITEGQFTTTRKINAFSNYDTFNRYSINFDWVRVVLMGDSSGNPSNLFLTINPYIRHRIYANSKKLKNNMVVGLGLNAFNSQRQRVMGGFFVQNNDLFGVHAEEEESLGKRFTIGLIAKFSFAGFNLGE